MIEIDALTRDGGVVRLRDVTAADAPALRALYGRGSPESLRLRFFGAPVPATLDEEIARLVRPPHPDHDVMVAEVAGEVVGVASYERRPPDSPQAEFAVFIDERHRSRGIGTLLLERLMASARRRGVAELIGEVLAGNAGMMRLASDLRDRPSMRLEQGVFDVGLPTRLDESTLEMTDARDRIAARASLRPLLEPRSVAVVGAGREPGGLGHAMLQTLIEFGFTGKIYAVNPNADEIAGVPSYPAVSAIPGGTDLVVVAVPAPAVAGVIADAGAAGARAAVIITSGFGETGAAGAAAQAELVRIARHHSIRLVGPNCLGVVNSDPAVRLAVTLSAALPPAGGLALAAQSGAAGLALLDRARRTGIGISSFVSLGNKADVSGNDLLSYWHDDPATTAVALYLESFGNPRRFARIARALARRKPVLAVFSGRLATGQRAGASHTAASASPAVAIDALCAQAGIVRTDHLGELLDTSRMVTDQPLPAGHRVAILGNAGGLNALAADAAAACGLRLPQFRDELRPRSAEVAGAGNPLDLGAGAGPEGFAEAADLIASSSTVDALVVVVAATRTNSVPGILAALAPVIDRHPDLPVAVVALATAGTPPVLGQRRAPVFDLPERAISALSKAAEYAAWRRQPAGTRPDLPDVQTALARSAVRGALAASPGWQPHPRIAEILGRYGIPMVPTATAIGANAAAACAEHLGFPVVLKAIASGMVPQSDWGGVKRRLRDAAAVRRAYGEIAVAIGKPDPPVLVQPMASGQVELIAGIVHDPLFGSLVMVGLGGVHTDLFADRAFRLVPMTDRDAGHMWRSLKAAPLLTGYRGRPPVDTVAIEDLLLRLGRLAEEIPEVAELNLNPVLASTEGLVVVDAKMRLAEVGAEPDAALRQLRPPS